MHDLTMSEVLALFRQRGAKMTRQALHHSVLPHWAKSGQARRTAAGWLVEQATALHWAAYVAEVQRRRAQNFLSLRHPFDDGECQQYTDGTLWNGE